MLLWTTKCEKWEKPTVSSCDSSTVLYLSRWGENAKNSRLHWMLNGIRQLYRYPGDPQWWDISRRKQNGMSWFQPLWNENRSVLSLKTPFVVPQIMFFIQDWMRRACLMEVDLMSSPHKLLYVFVIFHCYLKLPVWGRKGYSTGENRASSLSSMPTCCINKNQMKKAIWLNYVCLFLCWWSLTEQTEAMK